MHIPGNTTVAMCWLWTSGKIEKGHYDHFFKSVMESLSHSSNDMDSISQSCFTVGFYNFLNYHKVAEFFCQ